MFDNIKTEMALSIVRHVLTAAGALLVSKGWVSADNLEVIIGALLTMAATGWGAAQKVLSNDKAEKEVVKAAETGTVPTSVAKNQEVKTMVPTPNSPADPHRNTSPGA